MFFQAKITFKKLLKIEREVVSINVFSSQIKPKSINKSCV